MAKIISAYPDACLINQLRKFLRNWFCSSGRSETQVTAECRFPQLAKTEEVIWTKHFSHWKTLHPDEQNLFFGNINTYILQSGLKHSLSTPIFHFISRYLKKTTFQLSWLNTCLLQISWQFGLQKICHFFIFLFLPVKMNTHVILQLQSKTQKNDKAVMT